MCSAVWPYATESDNITFSSINCSGLTLRDRELSYYPEYCVVSTDPKWQKVIVLPLALRSAHWHYVAESYGITLSIAQCPLTLRDRKLWYYP